MEKIRLQKIIADCGYCSRRKAEEFIQKGKVKVNGHPAKLGDKATVKDEITVCGERLNRPRRKNHVYLMLNKPRGYVTTMSDELDRRCVTELLEDFPERGVRCQKCISCRLEASAEKADELGCNYFTTTLTISPHKDCAFINQRGGEIAGNHSADYLYSDFKKHEGYKHSIELSKKYGLYRQDYCGCPMSLHEAEARRTARESKE